jgi:hypothetical protein
MDESLLLVVVDRIHPGTDIDEETPGPLRPTSSRLRPPMSDGGRPAAPDFVALATADV